MILLVAVLAIPSISFMGGKTREGFCYISQLMGNQISGGYGFCQPNSDDFQSAN